MALNFRITPRACIALNKLATEQGVVEPVFSFAIGRTGSEKKFGIGIYSGASYGDAADIMVFDSMRIYLDSSMHEEFEGVVIDYREGQFRRDKSKQG